MRIGGWHGYGLHLLVIEVERHGMADEVLCTWFEPKFRIDSPHAVPIQVNI